MPGLVAHVRHQIHRLLRLTICVRDDLDLDRCARWATHLEAEHHGVLGIVVDGRRLVRAVCSGRPAAFCNGGRHGSV